MYYIYKSPNIIHCVCACVCVWTPFWVLHNVLGASETKVGNSELRRGECEGRNWEDKLTDQVHEGEIKKETYSEN